MGLPHRLEFYGLSDLGLARTTNEDQFLIAELSRSMLVHQTSLEIPASTRLRDRHPGYLFMVADGLGGAPEGARASSLAVDSVMRSVLGAMPWFFRLEGREGDLEHELRKILDKCELLIQADVAENPSLRGMGTTLTMAYLLWPTLYVVHVGDARAYLHRGSELLQITHDHTVSAPLPAPETTTVTPFRRVLWNVIGGENSEVWPDVLKVDLKEGDTLVLSTDGLTRHVAAPQMLQILTRSKSARKACEELVAAANHEGGLDNITVVVVRFARNGSTSAPKHLVATTSLPEPEEESATEGIGPGASA